MSPIPDGYIPFIRENWTRHYSSVQSNHMLLEIGKGNQNGEKPHLLVGRAILELEFQHPVTNPNRTHFSQYPQCNLVLKKYNLLVPLILNQITS